MEQKYYVAEKGDMCLSLTTHPGTLTEWDIIDNLERMMMIEAEKSQRKSIREGAIRFYYENIERIMQMVRKGDNLIPLDSLQMMEEDLDNELWEMGISPWMEWKFNEVEWD